jgi:hypothetical protein
MSISQDGNFLGLSCQLGGLRLNGIVGNTPTSGTAPSLRFVTIDDPQVVQTVSPSPAIVGYLEVKIGNVDSTGTVGNFALPFYIPLYQ